LFIIHFDLQSNETYYGVIRIRYIIPSSTKLQSSSLLKEEEDNMLDSLDNASVTFDQQQRTDSYSGEIHIIHHPVYCVPCPFLRIWDTSGQLMREEWIQSKIALETKAYNWRYYQNHHEDNNNDTMNLPIDHRIYHIGTLITDVHPLLNTFWLTLHICELEKQWQCLVDETVVNSRQQQEEEKEKMLQSVYLWLWLGQIGPYLGISLSPSSYARYV